MQEYAESGGFYTGKWLYMQLSSTKKVDFLLKEGGLGFKGRSVWFKTNLSLLIKQC